MADRQRLLWAVATRRQLERWEPLVADFVRALMADRQPDGKAVWAAQVEHHFTLIAAHNVLQALGLTRTSSVAVDPILRDELKAGRDLLEHWPQNMPIFMATPRPAQPGYPSGQRFAARNPDEGPYGGLDWTNTTGALLLPRVSAPELHDLLDAVEADVLGRDASFREYVSARAPSPWIHENGE